MKFQRFCLQSLVFSIYNNDNGNSSENVIQKVTIHAVSNFIVLIPAVLSCQMLAIFPGVEF